ncbi:MAG: phage integrase SAM-like domain-containing protein [Chitinophagaceae bacterium]|nr:phage integrase SAM-like domain-containing protein [Chitinophagaceae bacterium]
MSYKGFLILAPAAVLLILPILVTKSVTCFNLPWLSKTISMDSKLKSLFWLNKSKANKKGMAPIYIRLIKGKRKIEVSTGLFTPSKYWNTRKSKVLDGFDLANQINQSLDAYKKRLAQIQTLVLLQDEYIDLKKIKNHLLGISSNDKTLLEAIQYHNEMIASQAGKSFSMNTIKNYHFFKLKIERFLSSEHGISDILLVEITHMFLEQFINFMIVKDSNGPNTVAKNITLFKKIINMAAKSGEIDHLKPV